MSRLGRTPSFDPGDPPDPGPLYCQICGGDADNPGEPDWGCCCPECPTCGATGDPACYEYDQGHGLKQSAQQVAGLQRLRDMEAKERAQDEAAAEAEAASYVSEQEAARYLDGEPNVREPTLSDVERAAEILDRHVDWIDAQPAAGAWIPMARHLPPVGRAVLVCWTDLDVLDAEHARGDAMDAPESYGVARYQGAGRFYWLTAEGRKTPPTFWARIEPPAPLRRPR